MTQASRILDPRERQRARSAGPAVTFQADALMASRDFRREYLQRLDVVKADAMPMERSPDGLIKHIVNEQMGTKECCIDIYMQFIPAAGSTGTSRHLSEEIAYVVEGSGYDLHWDVRFDCKDEFVWEWERSPRRFDWSTGDFVYIPPYCAHRRFNADAAAEARVVVVNSRIVRAMGFDWFEQLEPAPGFEDAWTPPAD